MRRLARPLAALLVLALLAFGTLWWRLDAFAERWLERGASERLGVATEIRALLLRPLSGIVSLRGLEIANPPGFDGAFLSVDSARGVLDVRTLRRDVVEVREVTLRGVALTLEETARGSNYDPIVDRLGRDADAPAEGPQVRIERLVLLDVTARVRVGEAAPLTLEIPELELHQLGGPDGAGSGEITARVVRALLVATATRVPEMPFAVAARLVGALGLGSATDLLLEAGERGLEAMGEALRQLRRAPPP
jgi:hypothetical protein